MFFIDLLLCGVHTAVHYYLRNSTGDDIMVGTSAASNPPRILIISGERVAIDTVVYEYYSISVRYKRPFYEIHGFSKEKQRRGRLIFGCRETPSTMSSSHMDQLF